MKELNGLFITENLWNVFKLSSFSWCSWNLLLKDAPGFVSRCAETGCWTTQDQGPVGNHYSFSDNTPGIIWIRPNRKQSGEGCTLTSSAAGIKCFDGYVNDVSHMLKAFAVTNLNPIEDLCNGIQTPNKGLCFGRIVLIPHVEFQTLVESMWWCSGTRGSVRCSLHLRTIIRMK